MRQFILRVLTWARSCKKKNSFMPIIAKRKKPNREHKHIEESVNQRQIFLF